MLPRPRIEDLPAYDRLLADPRVPEHQFPARFRTPEFNELLLHKAIDHWDEHAFGPWNVWLGDELIGRAGVINSTFEGRRVRRGEVVPLTRPLGPGLRHRSRAGGDRRRVRLRDRGDPGLDDDHQPALPGGHEAARLRADRGDRPRRAPARGLRAEALKHQRPGSAGNALAVPRRSERGNRPRPPRPRSLMRSGVATIRWASDPAAISGGAVLGAVLLRGGPVFSNSEHRGGEPVSRRWVASVIGPVRRFSLSVPAAGDTDSYRSRTKYSPVGTGRP